MCLTPISLKTQDAFGLDVNQLVPCGKCLECLKDRQNSWKIRLVEEAREHKFVYFFTLTYNDDSVPFTTLPDGTRVNHVSKYDVQLWIKRNRIKFERMLKRDIDFKYFVTSEYGPNTGRPHYHGIIFTDISPTYISAMFSDWSSSNGFVNFSSVGYSDRKKAKAIYHVLETTLQSIVSNQVSWLPMPNVVSTDILLTESYHLHFI